MASCSLAALAWADAHWCLSSSTCNDSQSLAPRRRGRTTTRIASGISSRTEMTGIERQHTVFFLEDHHMVKSEFLESINSLLSCGDVPGIWAPDELEPLLAPRKEKWASCQGRGAVQPRTLFEYFVHQVRSHMRIVLSMDANHPHFLTFCSANPALFSCCNVMWLDD